MTGSRTRIVLVSALALAAAARAEAPPTADLVIVNAKVITLDAANTVAEAVAVKDGRIAETGTSVEMSKWIGPRTERIDAAGATLLPGLYDSHVHPLGAATSEKDHAIPSYRSLADIKNYIAERAKVQPKGSWIVVRYAFPTRLDESRFPTRAELDAIAPDHPVLHQAGPAGMVNTKALEVSGVTRETPDPPAGKVVRDPATGEATGMIRNAYSVLKGLPDYTSADDGEADAERVKKLFALYNGKGITSVGDRAASTSALRIYRGLRDRGELTVRVNATRVMDNPPGERAAVIESLRKLAAYDSPEPNGPTGVGDHWVRIGPMKLFL
ncbi:MAG TPA: amidohydrolase family protein, partial [Isosphaeraceae bacterium]